MATVGLAKVPASPPLFPATELGVISKKMEGNKPKIKFTVEGIYLQVLRSLSSDFKDCGKAGDILLSAHSEKKNLKLNDHEFICVYKGLLKALNNDKRYPKKSGNEYNTVMELKRTFEQLHIEQRGYEIRL